MTFTFYFVCLLIVKLHPSYILSLTMSVLLFTLRLILQQAFPKLVNHLQSPHSQTDHTQTGSQSAGKEAVLGDKPFQLQCFD